MQTTSPMASLGVKVAILVRTDAATSPPFADIFSSSEEMGEYGNGFSKVEKHFLEALQLAINNEKNVKGIVLNAFTEPFVLDREIFDIVQNMKSRIE